MIYWYLLLNESQVIICDHCEIIVLTCSIFLLRHYAIIIPTVIVPRNGHMTSGPICRTPFQRPSINQSYGFQCAQLPANAASKGHKRTQIVLRESFLLEVATWDALEICCTNSHWAILTQIPMVLVFLRACKNMSNEHVKSSVSDGTQQILQLREFHMPQPWAMVDVQSLGFEPFVPPQPSPTL